MLNNSTITQQPTPLAAHPAPGSDYVRIPLSGPTDSSTIVQPTAPFPYDPAFSTVDGIGKLFVNFHKLSLLCESFNILDPPTYEEAMSGQLTDDNRKPFKPLYPVYRRTPSYSTETNN